jgi:hypothetical protein
VPVLVALLVCLIPTTIGGLLSAIGISGIDRLVRHNVLATSGKAVEAEAAEKAALDAVARRRKAAEAEAAAIREVEAKREGASKEAQAIYDKQRDAIVSNANAQIRALNNETRER